ncbi:DNA-directed DNA polymerase delta [Clydaea vesicula]|uniref:DNA polymerase n=1 Tax=Clydaea vesicula TaxID=447962 RepID=A0AAD5XXL4_9FUNG|nr:DNA-directed DNA polymerase delta [Clydaea vesicula]
MELFVYNWEVLSKNPIVIRGHGLDINNMYSYIDIDNFEMISYHEDIKGIQMRASDNISVFRKFTKRQSKYIKDLKGHMSELPIVSMFTSIKKLGFCNWINCEKTIHPSPFILSFDIEYSDRIEMIGCSFKRYNEDHIEYAIIHLNDYVLSLENVKILPCKDELEIIDVFFELIKYMNPDVIIGFNIYGYDFDVIVKTLQKNLHTTVPASRPDDKFFTLHEMDWESSAYGSNKYTKISIPGRVIIDLYLYFKRFKLEIYSLEEISKKFLNESKDDMPYDRMMEIFKTRQGIDLVAKYCIKDTALPLKLFEKFHIWNDMCETASVLRCDIEDIFTRGEQLKVLNQMINECIKRNVVLVKRKDVVVPTQYVGAKVLDPTPGIYNNCAVLDFQSLYPSIMIAYNICSSTYISNFHKAEFGLIPQCAKNMLEERKKVKDMIKTSTNLMPLEKIVLDRKQNALKICANSMYGIMGFPGNKYFGNIHCAEMVTSIGRQCLLYTTEFISEDFGLHVVYGDTDSCFVQFPSDYSDEKCISMSKEICAKITSNLMNPMALNFECFYRKLILFAKKKYIMVKPNDNIIYKGVIMARRGTCKFAKDIYKKVIDMVAKNHTIQDINAYIGSMIDNLYKGNVDINDLTMTKSVNNLDSYVTNTPQYVMGRRLEALGEEITPGTRLKYVFVDTYNKKEIQGNKMFTPEEVIEYNLKIDYDYYISKQISNAVDQIFEVFGNT